jgi:hypothetical protein
MFSFFPPAAYRLQKGPDGVQALKKSARPAGDAAAVTIAPTPPPTRDYIDRKISIQEYTIRSYKKNKQNI